MESIKNRERKSNRFIACFKPIDIEETDLIASVENTADAVPPAPRRTKSCNSDTHVFLRNVVDSGGDDDCKDSMKTTKIKLSRVVKAVLFASSMAKKMQKKKSREYSFRSNSNLSTSCSQRSIAPPPVSISLSSSSSQEVLNKVIVETNAIPSSTNYKAKLGRSKSSSIGLSTQKPLPKKTDLLRSNSMDRVEIQQKRTYGDDWNYGLCLLLVSLFVMVLWGKACAILCTSAWIFIVRHRSVGHLLPECGVVVQDTDSTEYKKRIIMAGLLERNRSRFLKL